MHLWYVGILFEFYVILPLILMLVSKVATGFKQNRMQYMTNTITILTIISFVLYLTPIASSSSKFYMLPYRFFELGIDGIIALYLNRQRKYILQNPTFHLLVTILAGIICCSLITHAFGNYQSTALVIGMNKSVTNNMPIPGNMALLLTIVLTSIVIIYNKKGNVLLQSKFLSWIGKMSYSIFI